MLTLAPTLTLTLVKARGLDGKQPNFLHLIFYAFVTIPHQDCTKTITSLFTNFATKAKKTNPPNLAKPKLNQDQFLLQPKFSHLIFYAFGQFPTKIAQKP